MFNLIVLLVREQTHFPKPPYQPQACVVGRAWDVSCRLLGGIVVYLGLPRGFLYIILKIIIKPKFYQTTIAPILRQSFQAHYLPTFPTWINQEMATNPFTFFWLFLNWYKLTSMDYQRSSLIIRGYLRAARVLLVNLAFFMCHIYWSKIAKKNIRFPKMAHGIRRCFVIFVIIYWANVVK